MPQHEMISFEQGRLDSLCGIYSIVNAERTINKSSKQDSQELFNDIVQYLKEKELLSAILTGGMRLKNIKAIICDVVGDRIPYRELHFIGVKNPDLKSFWTEVSSFLGDGANRAVLLGISGIHNHWTVTRKISKNRIDLLDSDRLCHLKRTNCTTCIEKGKRHHVIHPAQTYFLGGE